MMERAKNIVSNFLSSRHVALLIFLWVFVVSIFVSSFVKVSPFVSILCFVIALGIFLVDRKALLICLIFFSFGLGSLRFAIKDFHEVRLPISTGIVASEPEHRDADTRFVFESDNGERALVTTDLLSPVEYGDRIEVFGRFEEPRSDEFDYAAYLSKDNIYWISNHAKIVLPAPRLPGSAG